MSMSLVFGFHHCGVMKQARGYVFGVKLVFVLFCYKWHKIFIVSILCQSVLFPKEKPKDKNRRLKANNNTTMELSVSQVYTSIACNRTPEIVDWNSDGLICYGASNAVVISDTVRRFLSFIS